MNNAYGVIGKASPAPRASQRQSTRKNTKGSASKKQPPQEKRRFKTRTQCPKNLHDRLHRSVSQRMYLVQRTELADDWKGQESPPSCDFTVAGSTGNIYTVNIDYVPTCTCPDFRRKHDLCKHIFFVLIKYIGVEQDSHLLYQKAFLSDEIRELLIKMEERRTGGVDQASAAVRAAYQKRAAGDTSVEDAESDVNRKSLEGDADCPICFDPLQGSTLVYCRTACGTNFHADCIQRWMMQGAHRSCPNCRQPWLDPNSSSSSGKKRPGEGYMNIADVTGQSPVRDTSTYYAKSRRRYY